MLLNPERLFLLAKTFMSTRKTDATGEKKPDHRCAGNVWFTFKWLKMHQAAVVEDIFVMHVMNMVKQGKFDNISDIRGKLYNILLN